MDDYVDMYIDDLRENRHMSKNTLSAYRRDIREFNTFLRENGVADVSEITNADVVSYMMDLKSLGRTGSTLNRKMASLRSYSAFLCDEGIIDSDPTENIKPPRVDKKEVEYLTVEEVERILDAPDNSVKGIRDRAILEMIYGTGIRVTEITDLQMKAVNFRIGFITCSGEYGKSRIIPLGRPCRKALENYIDNSRDILIKGRGGVTEDDMADDAAVDVPDEGTGDYVFVNYHGRKLTRQGLWKIVRLYAEKAGLDKTLTPQILRNSFAVHMVQNGADLKSIQELMGYEDISTAQVYLSVTKNRIKEVYDRTHPRA